MAAFDHAIAALPVPGKRIQIPTKDFTVVAIWYPQQAENIKPPKQLPTVILGQGFDAAQEERLTRLKTESYNTLTSEPQSTRVRIALRA